MTVSPTTAESAVPGHITIYVVPAHASPFLAAVQGAVARSAKTSTGAATSYSVVDVAHTWTQLNALTLTIARQHKTWLHRGIVFAMWGMENPSSNKVTINLKSYTPAAAKALYAAYGTSWISVSTKSMNMNFHFDQGRLADVPPFYGGDIIYNMSTAAACTDGFTMIGATHPQNHWAITSGHCGLQTWFTNLHTETLLGNTATDYYSPYGGNTNFDVQTIGPTNAWGTVWGNGDTTYFPTNTLNPGAGQLLTFDGAVTGEVHDVPVDIAGPVCSPINNIDTCGLGVAGSTNGPVICQQADSGGPIFQREPTAGPVQAVGLITASNNTFNECAYTLISQITGPTDTKLDTNPAG